MAVQLLRISKDQLGHRICWPHGKQLSPEHILYTMFLSNFIGICFARTLHYQFYCWYISSVPMLLLLSDRRMVSVSQNATLTTSGMVGTVSLLVAVMAGLELAFHIFPAKPWSSALLQMTHFIVMIRCLTDPPSFDLSVPTTTGATKTTMTTTTTKKD